MKLVEANISYSKARRFESGYCVVPISIVGDEILMSEALLVPGGEVFFAEALQAKLEAISDNLEEQAANGELISEFVARAASETG